MGVNLKKKVAYVIHDDGPGGGPQAIVQQLILAKKRFNMYVLHGSRGIISDFCEKNNISHIMIPLEKKKKVPLGLIYLIWHLVRLKPDALVLHGQWGGVVGAIAGKLSNVKTMLYITHYPSFYTDWDLFRIIRNHIVERIPCRLVDCIIPLSEGNRYQYLIRRLAPDEKFIIINNSFNLERVPDAATKQLVREDNGWTENECHVVSVGRLADQKRLDWLLESWRLVQNQRLHARLWIIGGGPEEGCLKKMMQKLNIENSCRFLGPKKGIDYIAASDIVAMTSLYEGHANLPLEAMGCGKPIVANDVDGVRDSLTDGVEGYLVPAADVVGFADRLIHLIDDPSLRDAMGARGRERAKAFYPSIKINQLLDLVEQSIASKKPTK